MRNVGTHLDIVWCLYAVFRDDNRHKSNEFNTHVIHKGKSYKVVIDQDIEHNLQVSG